MIFILRRSLLAFRFKIMRNTKILGGRGKEEREDHYLGLSDNISEVSEKWQTELQKSCFVLPEALLKKK